MSKIQEKLDSLQPYINGVRYIEGMQIVDAVFKEGWNVPNSEVIRKELVDKELNYYMFFSDREGVTFDDLLDYVENIIKINIERENKYILLKAKVKELQVIFKENSLSKLKNLKFSFTEEDITPSFMEMDLTEELDNPNVVDVIIDRPMIEHREPEIHSSHEVEANPIPFDPGPIDGPTIHNSNGQNIELPPRHNKVELENYDIPDNIKSGPCSCGENQACPKCMDYK